MEKSTRRAGRFRGFLLTALIMAASTGFLGFGCAGTSAALIEQRPEDSSLRPEIPIFFRGATSEEQLMVIEAYLRVTGFYESLGFPVPEDETVTFFFADVLTVEGEVYERAHGLYRKDARLVRMVSFRSESFQSRTILGEPEEAEFYTSLLCHEIAHFANTLHNSDMHPVVDECLAAFVQLSVMSAPVRNRFLSRYTEVDFVSYRDISVLTYVLDPPGFIAAAYRYCRDHPRMVRRFLRGDNPMIKDPFFID
jgi:hypothetical protein